MLTSPGFFFKNQLILSLSFIQYTFDIANGNGPYSFKVYATDNGSPQLTGTATVSLTITPELGTTQSTSTAVTAGYDYGSDSSTAALTILACFVAGLFISNPVQREMLSRCTCLIVFLLLLLLLLLFSSSSSPSSSSSFSAYSLSSIKANIAPYCVHPKSMAAFFHQHFFP